jgi:thiol:disulfide interchange protein DsbD
MKITGMIFGVKIGVLSAFILFAGMQCMAQLPDPTTWTYDLVKTQNGEVDFKFNVKLQKGWHIWSIHPGGDGTLIAPSFTFEKKADFQLQGDIKEIGKMHTDTLEGIEGKVNYYSDTVSYVQHILIKGKSDTLTATHQYQVCNNQMCLPPKDLKFTFIVTP